MLLLYHLGLAEYDGNFPSSYRLTPKFWETLELRRTDRIRQAFLVKRLQAQLLEALQIPRSRYRS